jgi:tetratricopeptide (TPR) repeat protein
LAPGLLATLCAATLVSAAELVINQNDTPLLAQCGGGNELAQLPEGQPVRLRFALAGSDNRCYSVSAEVRGEVLNGYVWRQALEGLEEFEKTRRALSIRQLVRSAMETLQVPEVEGPRQPHFPQSVPAIPPEVLEAAERLNAGRPDEAERILAAAALPADNRAVALVRGRALLEMTRPGDALRVLQPALRSYPRDANLLAMAGMSALQRDEVAAARNYLRQSLEIQHNPSIEKLFRTVEHETETDKSREVTHGSRFTLRYEGDMLPSGTAQKLTDMLDREITRVSFQLGCHLNDRLPVIVQSYENYRQTTGAAEWSGGRYDGRIRIAIPPSGEVDQWVQRTFSHEFVHACLSRTGQWPAWLHEGLAQRLSGDRLQPQDRNTLQQLLREQRLPSLESLGGHWGRLNSARAAVAYSLSLAAVQVSYEQHGDFWIRNLLNNPSRLAAVTGELDRAVRENLTRYR